MIVYGSGQLIGFPFGFSVGNFHFERNYTGTTEMIIGMKAIKSLNHLEREQKKEKKENENVA